MPKDDLFLNRNLLRVADYEFLDGGGSRDKFMIVLNRNEDSAYMIHALTTSQATGNNPKSFGCQIQKNLSYFYFPTGLAIAENGFSFSANTFVFFAKIIRKEELKALSKYPKKALELKGVVNKSCLKELIDCMLHSDFITGEQSD